MNVVFIGKSGVGKDTMQKMLCENFNYNPVIQATTRPKRDYEVDGVDYYFLTEEEFNKKVDNGEFFETTEFRGWKYGTYKSENEKENWVAVVNREGIKSLENHKSKFCPIALVVEENERLKRLIKRGDDKAEIVRRLAEDDWKYDKIIQDSAVVISNNDDVWITLTECLKAIHDTDNAFKAAELVSDMCSNQKKNIAYALISAIKHSV